MEIWKDIKDYEGAYQISSKGRFKSLARRYSPREEILKPFLTKDGYEMVELCKNNKAAHKRVNRLVAIAFIPNNQNKPQVNHIDGNKLNNCVENLEWVTNSENQIHAYKTGIEVSRKGEKHGMAKLKDCEAKEIKNIYSKGGITQLELSKIFKVSQSTINRVTSGNNWKHI